MPNENQPHWTKRFPTTVLPWLLGLMMLGVYASTLNHWITLANIGPVSKASGFTWQPEFSNPVNYLVTAVFRWLTPEKVPLAMNLFSAICAAITLGLLARCVAILPHNRTEMERTREHSDFSFLTIRSAWFPPVLAVAMFGLQSVFWLHATSFTGEMVSLLQFAIITWLLLEFRLDERTGRLTLAALIYGAGVADNWAFVGFLPVFTAALIWLRGLDFFNLRFLGRMALAGLAGWLSFLLLLPLVGSISSESQLSFWEMLRPALQLDWMILKSLGIPLVRQNLLLISATTLLPVLVMTIRWSASFGDSSRMGTALTNYMFHAVYAVMFTVCVWVMFDPPFSPHQLCSNFNPLSLFYKVPSLPLVFLVALCIGYYCGYYLLVFGKKASPTRRNPNPLTSLPGPLDAFSPVFFWGTIAAGALIVFTLAYKNLPGIRASNDDTLLRYARSTEKNLPAGGGILLSDADSFSPTFQTRTLLLQSELARSGRAKDFLVVDTQSLYSTAYHRFLHKQAPAKWPLPANDIGKDPASQRMFMMKTLDFVSKSNTVYYLNPSFGYYFELFYQEPHGLVYALKKLSNETLLPPPLSTNLVEENQGFWTHVADTEFPRLTNAIVAYDPTAHRNLPNWIIMHLHGRYDPNPNAVMAANFYSRSLDYWGVQLQRAGLLPDAAARFSEAKAINPDNTAATVNLEFNQALQAAGKITVDPSRANLDQLGKYRNWNALLNSTGPFDEPGFVYVNGTVLAQGSLPRQAIGEFTRIRQLVPDNLPARFWLAQLYLASRLPDPALEALHAPLTKPEQFGLNATNSFDVTMLAAAAHLLKKETARGIELYELEASRHPNDTNLLIGIVRAYLMNGLYTNALQIINRQLEKTPGNPLWTFGQGLTYLHMTNYNQAIASFSRVLEVATNEPNSLMNRAIAYLQTDRLKEARADFTTLQSTYTNSFQIAYGLGEVAWRQHDTNEAIRNYQLFLANAPTNSADLKTVRERLDQLQKK